MPRHIGLDGVLNLRDFGGYATACGRGLKTGLLYRSDAHHRATDADLEVIAGLGIGLVIDLRHPPEWDREVMRRWPGFSAQVLTSDWNESFPSWADSLRQTRPSPEFFRWRKLTWYRGMACDPGRLDIYGRYFRALARADGPVLIHCSAGKDRTGVLAALTQYAAGVAWKDIVADFLVTNEVSKYQRRLPRVTEEIRRLSGHLPDEATALAAIWVEEVHLAAAFDGIAEHYGSVDAYLERGLGFGPSERSAFEARFLG